MTNYYRILLLSLVVSFSACTEEPTLLVRFPSESFDDSYEADDFQLDSAYDYWEIRRGDISLDASQYEVLVSFSTGSVDASDQAVVDMYTSNDGFSAQCQPNYCPVYIVALFQGAVSIIDSLDDLVVFFNGIDTEAELFTYLTLTQAYSALVNPQFYEEIEGGYEVLLEWDSLCRTRGVDIVKVSTDGRVDKIYTVFEEQYASCI